MDCLNLFGLEGFRVIDSNHVETKKLTRHGRHRKRGESSLVKVEETIGFKQLKICFYLGNKTTYCTDGSYMGPLYVDLANRHDIAIIKGK